MGKQKKKRGNQPKKTNSNVGSRGGGVLHNGAKFVRKARKAVKHNAQMSQQQRQQMQYTSRQQMSYQYQHQQQCQYQAAAAPYAQYNQYNQYYAQPSFPAQQPYPYPVYNANAYSAYQQQPMHHQMNAVNQMNQW